MTTMKPLGSLDNWRGYFRRGDSDIFGIIDHAIMVAAADFPKEFKSRRDKIAELLYSCRVSRCIGCDHLELSIACDGEANHGRKTVEKDGGDSNHTFGEAKPLSDEQEEGSVTVDEVMKIKDILLNKEDEPSYVLLESLRKLDSMAMSVDVLKETKIGKAVNGLRRHSSDKISKLAKTLLIEWKELVAQWIKTPKEINGAEGTPESANLSVVEEEEEVEEEEKLVFPSPPYELDFFTPEPYGFELSKIFDDLDRDGNLLPGVESNDKRKLQRSTWRRPEVRNEAKVVDQQMRREEAVVKPMKHSATDFDEPRRQPKQTREQMRREETVVRPMRHSATEFDEPRRQPKQTREQMVPAFQRKPLVVTEQKRKLAGPQQDKLKAVDTDAKFEFAKRKIQESYQQHENAKRQRKIQILEVIPKKGKAKKPQFKRPPRR